MSGIRTVLRVAVVVTIACSKLSAQGHHGDHKSFEVDNIDESDVGYSMWDEVAPELRTAFDSAYSSVLDDRRGMDQVFEDYLDRVPAGAILEFLAEKHSYCHTRAHDLGVAVYRHYRDLGVAVSECGDGCSSACMHGAVREAFGTTTVNRIVASVDSVCAIDGMAETNRPGNCAHALGHALMMVTQDSLRASLGGCARFPGLSLPHYCATGVFMEYGANHTNTDSVWMNSRVASRYPCDDFPEFAAACYRYVMPRMRRILKTTDPSALASECRKLGAKEQLGCFRGIGVAFGGTVRESPEKIQEVCSDSNHDNVLVCIDALVEQISYLNPDGSEGAICAELEGEAHDVCTAALTGRYELHKPIMNVYLGTSN